MVAMNFRTLFHWVFFSNFFSNLEPRMQHVDHGYCAALVIVPTISELCSADTMPVLLGWVTPMGRELRSIDVPKFLRWLCLSGLLSN